MTSEYFPYPFEENEEALVQWAKLLVPELTLAFSRIDGVRTGTIILWSDVAVAPEGYLECDGTEYDAEEYPVLARVLPASDPGKFEVPDLTAPTDTLYMIKV